ncbi:MULTISPECIES: YjcZ family sporulation protein [unclassified Paenibacillus]|uniref:YjcZ family sporulation protein n=1 Tax=Paenibacillus sp. AN1007 TaxID=3151385 RepID=A0AAU8NIJ6_9BACL
MSQVGYGCGNVGGFGGAWTSTSAILVLFILLVIITKSFWL